MSDDIGKMADGRDSFAFVGDRNDIWHRKGNQHQKHWTSQDWARESGMNWRAVKVPAYACFGDVDASEFKQFNPPKFAPALDRFFICRNDNFHILSPGTVSKIYQPHQPEQLLAWFDQYIKHDGRFRLDTAGTLHSGETIFITALFEDLRVAGERHKARLLATTTFDGTGATINRGLVTRVVCRNTLDAGVAESAPTIVRTRHNTKFDADRIGKELAAIVASYAAFAAMGDAMAAFHATETDVVRTFKLTLGIPLDAKQPTAAKAEGEISKTKMGQYEDLWNAYKHGVQKEGLEKNTGWAMIQAITRYTDHVRTVRNSDGTKAGIEDTRFAGSVIDAGGSGSKMKATAIKVIDDLMAGALRAAADKAHSAALLDVR